MSAEIIISGLALLQGFVILFVQTRLSKKFKDIDQKFSREMADRERKDKYQLVALERRLEVHQRAYALSLRMKQTLEKSEEERLPLGKECFDFWRNNCLYLDDASREAFYKAIVGFLLYSALSNDEKDEHERRNTRIMLEWLPNVIARGVDLKALANEGYEGLEENILSGMKNRLTNK